MKREKLTSCYEPITGEVHHVNEKGVVVSITTREQRQAYLAEAKPLPVQRKPYLKRRIK